MGLFLKRIMGLDEHMNMKIWQW